MSKLVLFLPDGSTLDVPLARERTTIGRRADNDICLPNLAVSGEHAVIVTILADSFLEDQGSTNGTLVNGKAIAKHFLRDRDQIDIGRHKLVYCADDEAMITSGVIGGMARINARDFHERVEPAKPFVRARGTQAPTGPVADRMVSEVGAPASAAAPAPHPAASVGPPPGSTVPAASPASAPMGSAAASPPSRELPRVASVKVLSGVNAGVSIPLTKAETTIGRPGIQVASIVKAGTSFRLKPIEGALPPSVNGKPVERDGVDLAASDLIEIAGTQLEFADPARGTAKEDVAG